MQGGLWTGASRAVRCAVKLRLGAASWVCWMCLLWAARKKSRVGAPARVLLGSGRSNHQHGSAWSRVMTAFTSASTVYNVLCYIMLLAAAQ